MMKCQSFIPLFLILHLSAGASSSLTKASGGHWRLLHQNIGISATHMQLLNNDRVVLFDGAHFGPSNLTVPAGNCRRHRRGNKVDCTAHSAEYDVATNTIRPLMINTADDGVWCSSAAVTSDGRGFVRFVQTDGDGNGVEARVRNYNPCSVSNSDSNCVWEVMDVVLAARGHRRFYPTNHVRPSGRHIIIGRGRGSLFTYEFFPKTQSVSSTKLYNLVPFANNNNNVYPFMFLNTDGNIFIFNNNRAILFDFVNNKVVKIYPEIPGGGDPRTYYSSAVLLPLNNLTSNMVVEAEVLICGGAPKGSYSQALKGNFIRASNTCARIKITDPKPKWVIETMPQARVMADMTLLPNGDVLIINGAEAGTAGPNLGRKPVFQPVIYRPNSKYGVGSGFKLQNPSSIPRMYLSTAILLRDGRVLVGGSNPSMNYNFSSGVVFPTELRLEAFSPWYLDEELSNLRPTIIYPPNDTKLGYRQKLTIRFTVVGNGGGGGGSIAKDSVLVTMVSPSYTTNSFSMNHRELVLDPERVAQVVQNVYEVVVTTPPSTNLAPPGFYLLFVIHQEIPSEGIAVMIG
ncbi:aldehyde oxidase GLOX1 [Ziziphus jujuba]|uniref:Aldehyde oxidase GLOX1 n=1 Tax=Ziziphus jujuba TaxID=326968 RepID=A0A6P4BCM9_ZIZJJ|nr:aldehyde oxidase GLOX1 [Ziziphus jujuba]